MVVFRMSSRTSQPPSLEGSSGQVDGIKGPLYLWPPSFAYSKILTRGRYLSRHSRCLRAARYCKRFSRQAPWFSRSMATKSLRDGCRRGAAATATPAPRRRGERAALRHRGSVADTDNDLLKYMNSPCRFCTFSTSPESLNQLISSPYSPWAYSSALRHPAHWNR